MKIILNNYSNKQSFQKHLFSGFIMYKYEFFATTNQTFIVQSRIFQQILFLKDKETAKCVSIGSSERTMNDFTIMVVKFYCTNKRS